LDRWSTSFATSHELPPLPATGNATIDRIAESVAFLLDANGYHQYLGFADISLLIEVVRVVLPRFSTLSLKEKTEQTPTDSLSSAFFVYLVSPARPGSDSFKTYTGRELIKLAGLLSACDRELRGKVPEERWPKKLASYLFPINVLGFCAGPEGTTQLPLKNAGMTSNRSIVIMDSDNDDDDDSDDDDDDDDDNGDLSAEDKALLKSAKIVINDLDDIAEQELEEILADEEDSPEVRPTSTAVRNIGGSSFSGSSSGLGGSSSSGSSSGLGGSSSSGSSSGLGGSSSSGSRSGLVGSSSSGSRSGLGGSSSSSSVFGLGGSGFSGSGSGLLASSARSAQSSSGRISRFGTGIDHTDSLTKLGKRSLHPLLRLVTEQARVDPSLTMMPSSRRFDGANSNQPTKAAVVAESTIAHMCTTSRKVGSRQARTYIALIVNGWTAKDIGEVFGTAYAESHAFKSTLTEKVRSTVRTVAVKTGSVALSKSSPLFKFRRPILRELARGLRPTGLGHVSSNSLPTSYSRKDLLAIVQRVVNEEETLISPTERFVWTKNDENDVVSAWGSREGLQSLRRLSGSFYALPEDNPMFNLKQDVRDILRTKTKLQGSTTSASSSSSSISSSTLQRTVTPAVLSEVIWEVYTAAERTKTLPVLTFQYMQQCQQYWGPSGKGAQVVAERAGDEYKILSVHFVNIRSLLYGARNGIMLPNLLDDTAHKQLCDATLKVLQRTTEYKAMVELPVEFSAFLKTYFECYEGRKFINTVLTKIPNQFDDL